MISEAFAFARLALPTAVLLYGFTMFYMFAPRGRRPLSDVRIASIVVTILLQVVRNLLVQYLTHFSNFNRVYGTLGGVVALLLWIISRARSSSLEGAFAPQAPESELGMLLLNYKGT